MNINYEAYKIFYAVATNGNITKAAKVLLISQPGVSKAIKNLEEQIGCTLFIRNKKGVLLTNEGKTLYDEIRNAFQIIENAEHKLLDILNLETGIISIGISNSLTKNYLLNYLNLFHQNYPNVKINIHTNPTIELINKLRTGIIDFIILNLPFNVPSDCETKKLKEIHDIFVANNKYSFLQDTIIDFNDINKYPLVLLAKGSNTRTYLDDCFFKKDIILKPEMEIASYSLVTEFAKIGLGISLVTKEFVKKELESNELFEIKTNIHLSPRYIGIMTLKDKTLSHAAANFVDILNNK